MKKSIAPKLAALAGVAALSVSSVNAADSGVYTKLEPGVSFISGSKLKVSGTLNDAAGDLGLGPIQSSGSASYSIKYNAGFGINGALGYRFNETIALELEGGYQINEFDSLAGISLSGLDLRQWSGFGNLVLGYKLGDALSASVGAGLGFVNVGLDIPGADDLGLPDFSNTSFAGQLKANLTFQMQENVSFILGYRAQLVDSGLDILDATIALPSGGSAAAKISTSGHFNHQITAGISIGF